MVQTREYLYPSFPTRERGLKSVYRAVLVCYRVSFPTRERGLKFVRKKRKFITKVVSFPTRERGLKSDWFKQEHKQKLVVPHAGTWIEIKEKQTDSELMLSFPTRERGLKSSLLPQLEHI